MSNLFSKFFVSFGLNKKNKYLPAPGETMQSGGIEPFISKQGEVIYSAKPYKTLVTFDLQVNEPKYSGEVPDATIKFYPLDNTKF
ncbi:MAG: hypothetical protein IJ215_05665 [Clostridia bacterium]|nr:hypothetical protein [Clostridia bacterium]